jgi:hypothetical protein
VYKIERPKCKRCGGPLDLWQGEEKHTRFICNNPSPLATDEQFAERWKSLSGDDMVRLIKSLEYIAK